MGSDGEIIINTEIQTDGAAQGAKGLKKIIHGIVDWINGFKDGLRQGFSDGVREGAEETAKGVKKVGDHAKGAVGSIANMTKALFKFSAITSILKKVWSIFKQGVGNLAQYSSEVNTAISGLMSSFGMVKNNIVAAFSPIITAVAPMLVTLINLLNQAVSAISQFIAAIAGKSTYTKAIAQQTDYAKSLKKTAGAAKEAAKELFGFDTIQKLGAQKGGGGGGGADAGGMFEEAEIDSKIFDILDRLKEINLEPLMDSLKRLGEAAMPLKQMFVDSLGWVLDNILIPLSKWTIEEALPRFVDVLAAGLTLLVTALKAIQPLWQWFFDTFIVPVSKFVGDAILKFLDGLAEGIQGVSKWISDNQESFQFFVEWLAVLAARWMALEFMPGLIASAAGALATLAGAFLAVATPANLIIGLVALFIAKIIDLARHDSEVADQLRTAWNGIGSVFTKIYNNFIKPVFDKFYANITSLWNNYLKPLWDHFNEFLAALIKIGLDILNQFIIPVLSYFADKLLPGVTFSVNMIQDIFDGLLKFILIILDGLLIALTKMLEWLHTGFTEGWRAAWEGVAEVFRGVFNSIMDLFERGLNWMIDGINDLIEALNDVADDLPFVDSDLIPTLNRVSLPRLATGTVVPPNAGEFAAILGDNNHETEVVSPLSTMKQAMLEALAESNIGNGNVTINFTGNLAQLARVLKPEIDKENKRVGTRLVTG